MEMEDYINSIVDHITYYLHISLIILKVHIDSGCFLVSFLNPDEKQHLNRGLPHAEANYMFLKFFILRI